MKLECKKVSKVFGANPALTEVDLTVESGEIRALLGGNGSGKSTMSKIIGGALGMTEGTMEIDGRSYAPRSTIEARRRGIVFTSQELSLFDNLTVEENMMLCGFSVKHTIKVNKKEIYEKAREFLDHYGLLHLADKKVGDLAANEQYMVEFMKAIIQKPEILIIDEITSALYREDVKIVWQVMQELKEAGKIILFISHRMPEIMEMCDSVTVLRNGVIVGSFDTGEVTEAQLVSKMTGREIAAGAIRESQENDMEEEADVLLKVNRMSLPQFGTEVDLSIRQGEIIGVAGLQGHGQADLVRQLFGLSKQIHPEVELAGEMIRIHSPASAIWHGISFISGDRGIEGTFGERTIEENVQAVPELILHKKVEEDAVLEKYKVKYGNKRDLITSLSGGNQQKVVIARWLSCNPKLLLADDPTKGIDVQARTDVHKIMADMAREGSSVLMVSSDDEELVNLTRMADSSRVIVMYEGRIVKTLRGGDITVENIAAASVNLQKETEEVGQS